MNANELADLKEFEKMLSVGYLPAVKQAIEMLCQQQAEIKALKLCCHKCGGAAGISEVLNVPENVEPLKHEIERLYRIIELNGTIK